ncbi:hypothetical protein [Mariniblastus fucicola]|uniref:TraB family protein n=1 Tax=Mariniblastus fucicola TaxID=980251 RepID=A0A5B9PEB1_9BACT|nr:hypothetical protein [Mariniblastus fucicola]QEG23535.1 hypothetical protein MFFC18_34360 [Mariniblastus fucicola]
MFKNSFSYIGFMASLMAAFFVSGLIANGQQETTKQKKETSKKTVQEENSPNARFLRIRRDHKGRPVAMETSVVRYQTKNEDGETVIVDLIGAVHVGEKSYYETLNNQFEQYESLLYELVAPEGTVIPKGGRVDDESISLNPVGGIQKGLKNLLDLEFQLEKIDYTKGNFVHADMTPTEFGESMKSNEESIGGYALKAMGQSMAMQASGKDTGTAGMIMALFSSDKSLRMRRVMAQQMIDMEAGLAMFEGKDGSTIINHRNAKCMEVLKEELASGKKKIAIFYGAGHLADMEKRLISDFQMNVGGQKWIPAWTLTKRKYER